MWRWAVLRIIIYLVIGLAIVLFASQNMDAVTVYLVAGGPLQISLIVIIGISFFGGFVTAIFFVIQNVIRGKKRKSMTVLDPGLGR